MIAKRRLSKPEKKMAQESLTELGQKPLYIASAAASNGKWVRIGAAWQSETANGKPYLSLRVDVLPLSFDGHISLFPNEDK